MITFESVEGGYEPGLPILRGASLEVRAGEIMALLGPNGAGKSTLVKAAAGLVPVWSGRITLEGRDITRLATHRMVGAGLGFVPQTENVFASLSIQDNLLLAQALVPKARRGDLGRVYALFPDLERQRKLAAGRLSGGQRQMLAVARALLASPSVLMLDEPSAGLSPKLVGVVFERLRAIRDSGVTILLVEQNVRAALAIADRAAVLVEGRERLVAPAAEIDPAQLGALYLGAHA